MGDLVVLPGNAKTIDDERALLERLIAMQEAGQDGVEAGLKTTEFWMTALAVVIDVAGPHYGFLQGIDASEQGLIAMGLVLGYGALRSWRKRGGPAKALAQLAALLAQTRAAASAVPPAAPTMGESA